MQPPHAHRRWLAFVWLILASVLVFGCSSQPTKVGVNSKAISHADADDIAQIIATTVSADNGGWYFLIKAVCESLSVPAPNILTGGPHATLAMPSSSGPGTRNSFSLAVPGSGITYNMQVGYVGGRGLTSTRDIASVELDALVSVDGGIFTSANGIEGTYGCHTYTVSSPTDSFFIVTNLTSAGGDTLEFTGQFYDSCFALVHSAIAPNAKPRLWFMGPDNFFDYVLRIPKSKLASAPYPIGKASQINWVIEAKRLTSVARDDWEFDDLVEIKMTFDGTEEARLSLGNIQPYPDWEYTYRVNLNTGRITRTN